MSEAIETFEKIDTPRLVQDVKQLSVEARTLNPDMKWDRAAYHARVAGEVAGDDLLSKECGNYEECGAAVPLPRSALVTRIKAASAMTATTR